MALSEAVGPSFIVSKLVKGTTSSNKPKVVSETCKTMILIIAEYGVQGLNLKEVIDYCKGCIT